MHPFLSFLLLGIFYGIFISVLVNSFIQFLNKKQKDNLVFFIYYICVGSFILIDDQVGRFLIQIFSIPTFWLEVFKPLLICFTIISLVYYIYTFLSLDKLWPKSQAYLWFFTLLRCLLGALQLTIKIPQFIIISFDLLVIISCFSILIYRWNTGYKYSGIYLLGFLSLFPGLIFHEVAMLTSQLNTVLLELSESTLHIGFMLQLILQNTAIARRSEALREIQNVKKSAKEKEFNTQQSRSMLMDILDFIPHQIFLKDSKHRLVLVNKRMTELFGQNREALIGKTDFDLFEKKVATEYYEEEAQMLQSGKEKIVPEFVFYAPNGEIKLFHSMKMPFFIRDTNEKGLLGIEIEITESKRIERELKDKSERIERQSLEIEEQKHQITDLYNEVKDSIKTAKLIQDAILPPKSLFDQFFKSYFILYAPRDIVSGDFYWLKPTKDFIYFATVDCTGHGVAGAFISMIANSLLHQLVDSNPNRTPAEILNLLDKEVINALHQGKYSESGSKDGLDITLCKLNLKSLLLEFAGAGNPLYVIRKGELSVYKTDPYSIGYKLNGKIFEYTHHEIQLISNDQLYLFSDGFAGQLGGIDGFQKFMYPRFREVILYHSNLEMTEQSKKLSTILSDWKGDGEQTDDIMLIGLQI